MFEMSTTAPMHYGGAKEWHTSCIVADRIAAQQFCFVLDSAT
jgi:hypothetical protein